MTAAAPSALQASSSPSCFEFMPYLLSATVPKKLSELDERVQRLAPVIHSCQNGRPIPIEEIKK